MYLVQTKFKWGSRPQYGDWGISQPASAGTLKRLTDRLMAFVGRAKGEETVRGNKKMVTEKFGPPFFAGFSPEYSWSNL